MSIGGDASARGGTGAGNSSASQLGGVGGAGGKVTLIAHAIGLMASLSAAGGSGGGNGSYQGPGGAGGSITAFTNCADIQQPASGQHGRWRRQPHRRGRQPGAGLVSHSPRTRTPGARQLHRAQPRCDPLRTRDGWEARCDKGASRRPKKGLDPTHRVCKQVKLQVVAVSPGVAWTSDASSAINYTRQPSKTQTCAAPPKLNLPGKLGTTVASARRAHWVETLRFRSAGSGRCGRRSATGPHRPRHGHRKLTIRSRGTGARLRCRADREAGSGSLKLTEISPDGSTVEST